VPSLGFLAGLLGDSSPQVINALYKSDSLRDDHDADPWELGGHAPGGSVLGDHRPPG